MSSNDANGTGGFANGSPPPPGPSPPSPPLRREELYESISNGMRAVQTIQQLPNIVANLNALVSDNRGLDAAINAYHDRILEAMSKNNDLQSQVSSKDQKIQDLQALVQKLEKDDVVKTNALRDSSKDTARLNVKLTEQAAKIDDLSKAKKSLAKDNKGLEAQVALQAADLVKVKAKLDQLQGKHNAELSAIQSQLDTLNSYAVPVPADDLPLNEITRKLNIIFQGAFRLVKDCFDTDLPSHAFAGAGWATFLKKVADTRHAIPLPASNSIEAKRMRTAAVLRLLGNVAQQELFQPFYALGRGDELSELVDERIVDVDHAEFVRRVLLNTESNATTLNPRFADYVPDQMALRADEVCNALKDAVGGILSPKAHNVFFTALGRWCKETMQVWQQDIQPLQFGVQVHNEMDNEDDDATVVEEWRLLSELLPDDTTPLAARCDVAAHVWPFFWHNGEVALKGVVVTEALVAAARHEAGQITMQKDSGRRMSRAGARRSSTAESMSAPSTPNTATGNQVFPNRPSPSASGGGGRT